MARPAKTALLGSRQKSTCRLNRGVGQHRRIRADIGISGTYRRALDTMSGRFVVVEKSREFTLVPWRPVLDRHFGKSVSGIMRGDGISWSFGRGRSGPSVS